MHLLSIGVTAECTLSVSVSFCALSGQYVLYNGAPQLSFSTGLEDLCIVLVGCLVFAGITTVGRLLDELVVGRFAVAVVGRCWWLVELLWNFLVSEGLSEA